MTKTIIAAGKTAHCGRCHAKRMFWLGQDGRYHCESCGMALLPADKVKAVTDAAYAAYASHVTPGGEGNETAVAAGRMAWKKAVEEDCIDQLIDEEKEAERLAEIAASYDEAWY